MKTIFTFLACFLLVGTGIGQTHSSATVTVTVTAAPVAAKVTAAAAPSTATVGTPVIVTAKVAAPSGSSTVPAGTVSFYQGSATGTLISTAPLVNGAATCTFTTAGLAPGAYTVTSVFNSSSALLY